MEGRCNDSVVPSGFPAGMILVLLFNLESAHVSCHIKFSRNIHALCPKTSYTGLSCKLTELQQYLSCCHGVTCNVARPPGIVYCQLSVAPAECLSFPS